MTSAMRLSFLREKKYLLLFFALLLLLLPLSVFAQGSFADAVGGGAVNTAARLLSPILVIFVWLTKFIFQLASWTFLWIVDFTILDFGRYWSGEGGDSSSAFDGLKFIWEFVRDFVNFFIVIFFLSIAMATSFGDGSFGFHRKTLVFLLILAILINFSAFFTLFFIDISHMLFAVFLNVSQIEMGAKLLLFDEYGSFFTSQGSPVLNLFLQLTQITANWFLALGFFYFCLILIQRFIVAILLIVFSPLAALGATLKFSGSNNAFSGPFVGGWDTWVKHFLKIIIGPIVLIFGLSVITSIFNAILSEAVRPENLPAAQGIMSNMALFTQLFVATILLVYGIFKVGNMAQELKLGVGKYTLGNLAKFGEGLQTGKAALGALRQMPWIRNTDFGKGKEGVFRQTFGDLKKVWSGQSADFKGAKNYLSGRGAARRRSAAIDRALGTVRSGGALNVAEFSELSTMSTRDDLSDKEISKIADLNDRALHASLVGNKNASEKNIDEMIFDKSGNILSSSDDDKVVLSAAAKNKNISSSTLEKIINDPNVSEKVKDVARSTQYQKEYQTDDDSNKGIELNDQVKKSLILRAMPGAGFSPSGEPNIDLQTILKFAGDTDNAKPRIEIAKQLKNFYTDKGKREKILDELLKGEDSSVVNALLQTSKDIDVTSLRPASTRSGASPNGPDSDLVDAMEHIMNKAGARLSGRLASAVSDEMNARKP